MPTHVIIIKVAQYTFLLSTFLVMLYAFNSKSNKYLFLIKWLLVASFLGDVFFRILYDWFDYYLPYTSELYRIAEIILVGQFFIWLLKNKAALYACRLLQVLVILLILIQQKTSDANILSGSCYTIFSILFFYLILKELALQDPLNEPNFWIVSGIFLHAAGTIFLFLLFDAIAATDGKSASVSFLFQIFLGILKNILFGIAFYKANHYKTSAVSP